MVSHLNSFKYVEMDGEFIETPCQTFEVIPPTIVVAKDTPATPKIVKDSPRIASVKDARTVVEEGNCTIWGQLPYIPYKSNKFSLGFSSKAQKEVRRICAGGPPFRIRNNEVNALEDTDNDGNLDDWIFLTTDGGINNWKAKDFVSISFIQEYLLFPIFICFKKFVFNFF